MIKIFTSNCCNNCKITTQYFKSHNINFEEIEVNDEIGKELAEKGFTMLPVLEVEGTLMSKLSKDDLDKLIENQKNTN